jgi:hypothetical protein
LSSAETCGRSPAYAKRTPLSTPSIAATMKSATMPALRATLTTTWAIRTASNEQLATRRWLLVWRDVPLHAHGEPVEP